MMIRGKYFEVDFSKAIGIHTKNKERLIIKLESILDAQLNTYIDRYNQGFLDITNPELLDTLPATLTKLKLHFIKYLDIKQSLETNILQFTRALEDSEQYDEDIIHYMWDILHKLNVVMHFETIENLGPVLLKMHHENPDYLFDIPDNVVGIIYEQRPSASEIAILESKFVPFIVTKKTFSKGSSQKVSPYDLGFLPGLSIVDKTITKSQRGKFKLGVAIHHKKQIKNALVVDPDYIVVQPEKAYSLEGGVVKLGGRETFYKYLIEAFPKTPILVILPKLTHLDTYFNIGNEIKMDIMTVTDQRLLFEKELRAIFKYHHEHISISIPDIEDVNDFNKLRVFLQETALINFGIKAAIGLVVDTPYSAQNIWMFKKFSHAIVDLDNGYDNIQPKAVDSSKYALEYAPIHNAIYRKSKTSYLIGSDLNNPIVLQKFMKRGFRNFTIKPALFDLYSSIIYRYNLDHGVYSKNM